MGQSILLNQCCSERVKISHSPKAKSYLGKSISSQNKNENLGQEYQDKLNCLNSDRYERRSVTNQLSKRSIIDAQMSQEQPLLLMSAQSKQFKQIQRSRDTNSQMQNPFQNQEFFRTQELNFNQSLVSEQQKVAILNESPSIKSMKSSQMDIQKQRWYSSIQKQSIVDNQEFLQKQNQFTMDINKTLDEIQQQEILNSSAIQSLIIKDLEVSQNKKNNQIEQLKLSKNLLSNQQSYYKIKNFEETYNDLFEKEKDLFVNPLSQKFNQQIYTNEPAKSYQFSYLSQNFMKKQNYKGAPAPTCVKYNEFLEQEQKKSLKYSIQEMLQSQKGVLSEIVSQKSKLASGLFAKKQTQKTYQGFPLKYFEDQTYLQRISEWFSNVPHFLSRNILTEQKDPLERMKLVTNAIISTIYMTSKPSKPFNPILGETYQAYFCKDKSNVVQYYKQNNQITDQKNWPDIFKIFVEQTSHHPPISNFLIENSILKIYGNFELIGNQSNNSYTIQNKGPCTFHFTDTDQIIQYELPSVVMGGTIWGNQSLTIKNSLVFIDKKNLIKAHITFGKELYKLMPECNDQEANMAGIIYKFKNINKFQTEPKVQFNKLSDIDLIYEKLWGQWQTYLCSDKQGQIWHIDQTFEDSLKDCTVQCRSIGIPNPLPSDSRYREDLLWVKKKNLNYAEQWKFWMEEQQRHEESLRHKK